MKQFLIALMVMGCASAALAQGPGGRGGGGVMGLVSMAEVQKELSMTEAQIEKFTALRGERGSQQDLSREERQKRSDPGCRQSTWGNHDVASGGPDDEECLTKNCSPGIKKILLDRHRDQ